MSLQKKVVFAGDDGLKQERTIPEIIFGTPIYDKLPKEAIAGQIVAVRGVLNVKVKNGMVDDEARLRLTARDLAQVLKDGGTPVLWGHIGRDWGVDLIDLDSVDGAVIINTLRKLMKEYDEQYDINYNQGVITKDGVDSTKVDIQLGQVNLLNNIRVFDGFESPDFASQLGQLFANNNVETFISGAFADIGSKGPESVDSFLDVFEHAVWSPAIAPEMLAMEEINNMKVIQFAGSKLEKADILLNLRKLMVEGGTIFVGSAIAAKLLYSPDGQELLTKLGEVFNILREGEQPQADKYNLAIPEVIRVEDVILKGVSTGKPGYVDITEESAAWICSQIVATLTPGDKALFNGIVSWKETGHIEPTKAIISEFAKSIRQGVKMTLVGGDGPANFKDFSGQTADQYTEFSGGGVPLKYGTDGEKKLPMVVALRLFQARKAARAGE